MGWYELEVSREYANEPSGFRQFSEILEQLSDIGRDK
jgi:hypothetical protein